MNKFKSRKFILSLLTALIGASQAFSESSDASLQMVGILVASISTALYTICETVIDRKGVENE